MFYEVRLLSCTGVSWNSWLTDKRRSSISWTRTTTLYNEAWLLWYLFVEHCSMFVLPDTHSDVASHMTAAAQHTDYHSGLTGDTGNLTGSMRSTQTTGWMNTLSNKSTYSKKSSSGGHTQHTTWHFQTYLEEDALVFMALDLFYYEHEGNK